MIDESEFRRVIGHFATGVAVVTSCMDEGAGCGLTVSSVASVSLDPTMILVCLAHDCDTHDWLQRAGFFAANFIEEGKGETIARRFAGSGTDDKFRGLAWHTERTGAPVLDDALAWLDCRVVAAHPAGDHTIFVGEVLAADAREGTPLLYYRGGYGRFAS